jgi:mannose-6-phosphate isomerase-like protein (cupin superfamily)
MTRNGQILHNPVTGERVKWHLTSADTDGRLIRAEWWARPGGGATFEHVHREAEERFEVLAGHMAAELAGKRVDLRRGERISLPPGVPHRWWNAGGDDLHFLLEIEPPGHFEQTIETLFGLAREGRVKANGSPDLLQMAVMGREFGFEAYPASLPLPLLRAAAGVRAPLGRALGRQPVYPAFSRLAPPAVPPPPASGPPRPHGPRRWRRCR